MKIKYIVYALIVLLLGYLIYNRITKSGKEAGAAATKGTGGGAGAPINVNGYVVAPTNYANAITSSGSIEANEQVEIRSEVSGVVRSINFNEGSLVSKGQLLCKIDDRELKAQLQEAETREKVAGENAGRSKKLLAAEAISQEEFGNVNSEYFSLRSQTQLIRVQLSKTEIRAPFSGRIGLRNISPGSFVTSATNIASLVNINPVKVTFSLPEKYIRQVSTGTKITFSVAGVSKKYYATVYAIEPSVNVTTRSLMLRATAPNPEGNLLPGTFAKVDLPLTQIKGAILIPTLAIVPVLKGKQVFIANNGKAKAVPVESDIRTDSLILISSGLKNGDTVITSGLMALKDGSQIKVTVNPGKKLSALKN